MSWFKTDEKAALDEAVRAASKPATRLIVEGVDERHVLAPTESHFGGSPYAEAGEGWPTRGDEKRPYDFVSRVGGYPSWVQDNTLEHDGYIFVAQIGYEPAANNCIQDAGPIYIAAMANEPTKFVTDAFQSF